jgi:hypothetical protein
MFLLVKTGTKTYKLQLNSHFIGALKQQS